MKISKQKLKKTARNSNYAKITILLSFIYLLMMFVKGVFLSTSDSTMPILVNINIGAAKLIFYTYIFPISYAWNTIPDISFGSLTLIDYYAYYLPPIAINGFAYYFIHYHLAYKRRYLKLEAELDREDYLNRRRHEKGLIANSNKPEGVVVIQYDDKEPFWHETWWGKIVIGIAVIIFAAALGLRATG